MQRLIYYEREPMHLEMSPAISFKSVIGIIGYWVCFNQEKLEMVQRRAARFVNSRYRRTDSVTAMLDKLGWPILSKKRKDARLIF